MDQLISLNQWMSDFVLWNNSLRAWLVAGVVFFVSFYGLKYLRYWLQQDGAPGSLRQNNPLFKVLRPATRKTYFLFLLALALYSALYFLQLPAKAEQVIAIAVTLAIFVQLIIWANSLIDHYAKVYSENRPPDDRTIGTALGLATFVAKAALLSLLVLLALDQMGVNITALIAGLGIGGVAIALALQNILSDLFSSLTIVLDKPFAVGDFLVIGDFSGAVERVGLKTTRVRSLSGELLIFSNSDLLQSRIRNFQSMNERRAVFHFGVLYETPYEQLVQIPEIVKEIVERRPMARFDRAHFQKYGDFSLDFEVVYYVKDRIYLTYMDAQQAINLELFKAFAERGIGFAYPTRTVYVNHVSAPGTGSADHKGPSSMEETLTPPAQ